MSKLTTSNFAKTSHRPSADPSTNLLCGVFMHHQRQLIKQAVCETACECVSVFLWEAAASPYKVHAVLNFKFLLLENWFEINITKTFPLFMADKD